MVTGAQTERVGAATLEEDVMPIIVCFEGRLAADPQLVRTANAGTAVCEAVVMINHRTRRQTETGEQWVDAPTTRYFVKGWRRRAEALATLRKGASVVVVGHVETESWEDQDGQRHYRDTVVIDSLGETVRPVASQ